MLLRGTHLLAHRALSSTFFSIFKRHTVNILLKKLKTSRKEQCARFRGGRATEKAAPAVLSTCTVALPRGALEFISLFYSLNLFTEHSK